MKFESRVATLLLTGLLIAPSAFAQSDEQALAQQLSNPVAALISVPLQLNYSQNIGPLDDGSQWVLNIQPVIPISISDKWNLISRTILPVVSQSDLFPGAGSQFGIGDIVQSFFFSPKAPTSGGLIWGVGPVLLLPTGSDPLLTGDKWGAGPSAVVLKQAGPWTVGALVNHIWSFAGSSNRNDISSTFLQPFVSYGTPKAVTFTVGSESTYNWETKQWSVPLLFSATKVTRIGTQLVSYGGGVGYFVESPDNGAQGWRFRGVLTLLFPR